MCIPQGIGTSSGALALQRQLSQLKLSELSISWTVPAMIHFADFPSLQKGPIPLKNSL